MSLRSNGSYIGPRPAGPSSSVASGIWDLRTAERQQRAGAWPQFFPDPYFSSVSLLLHMDGSGSTFTDSSGTPKTVTANGNATQSTTQSKFGGKSAYFDGTGDSLTTPTSADLSLNGDFTVECWVRWNGDSRPIQQFVGSNASSFTGNACGFRVWGAGANGYWSQVWDGRIGIYNTSHDGPAGVSSVSSITPNQWTHVAATREGGIIRVFIDGNLEGTGTADTSVYDFGQSGCAVGQSPWDGSNGFYAGYIDDLRITKGVARYTANFTPPTAPFPDA